jgi:hypothetical protein
VLLVDDGSSQPPPTALDLEWGAITEVQVLHLYSNLGHQRAICTGLVQLAKAGTGGAVVVMDADGEDDPAHVPVLVQHFRAFGEGTAVFAARARRTEGLVFRTFYFLYRLAHRLLVGLDVRIGNFSVLPMRTVQRLVRSTDLWNHYAAAAVRSRTPMKRIALDRATRLRGNSRMNFVSLVVHGLSAMAVFGQTIAVRLLIVTLSLAALAVLGLTGVILLRFFSDLAIPGWATSAAGLLSVLLLQVLLAATIFALSLLASRSAQTVVPIRDCMVFVESVQRISAVESARRMSSTR